MEVDGHHLYRIRKDGVGMCPRDAGCREQIAGTDGDVAPVQEVAGEHG